MFNVVPKSASMKDVAKEAGYHISTVSLALRGDERISPSTRERIVESATKLGYKVHPVVSAWVSARRSGSQVDRHLALGYLSLACSQELEEDVRIFEAARKQAKSHGFSLTRFSVSDYSRNYCRLDQVLKTRNVQGLILGLSSDETPFEGIDWQSYSLVSLGVGHPYPRVHRVAEDGVVRFEQVFQSLLDLGYRNIGLAFFTDRVDARREDWIRSFLYLQRVCLDQEERIPIFEGERGEFALWQRENVPDVVLSDSSSVVLSQLGVPFYNLSDSDQIESLTSATTTNYLGCTAIDMLIDFVTSNQRGIPESRKTVLVEPVRCSRKKDTAFGEVSVKEISTPNLHVFECA